MKVLIETLGCPKNAEDSEKAAGYLERGGHQIVDSPEEADAIIVNTCGFINDAKEESIERIFDMASYKKGEKLLIVSGCLSQRYGEDLYEEMPEVDIFLGVNEYPRLPEILDSHKSGDRVKHVSSYDAFQEAGYFEEGPRKLLGPVYSAGLKIAEGCSNVCAYCVIPFIRGKYRSRKLEDLVKEAESLADQGCKELILIAQDVTSYGMDIYGEYRLPALLKELCKIDGIRWIRLMYCYEDRITDELIKVMAEEEKICPYIDIPIQHASDKILKAMNRRSTKASIINTIERLRKAMPDICIRTTFITGFPGEQETDFNELYDFVQDMKFDRLGVFAYSKEEGTAAAAMEEQVPEETKAERRDSLMAVQREISLSNNERQIGKMMEVLIEGQDEDGTYYGRSRCDAPEIDNGVMFRGKEGHLPGSFAIVKITDAYDYDLIGEEV